MTIRVKLFAILREKAGLSDATLLLPETATVAAAVDQLSGDFPATAPYLKRCAYAVNQTYMPADTLLHDNDELAIIPPVSGG